MSEDTAPEESAEKTKKTAATPKKTTARTKATASKAAPKKTTTKKTATTRKTATSKTAAKPKAAAKKAAATKTAASKAKAKATRKAPAKKTTTAKKTTASTRGAAPQAKVTKTAPIRPQEEKPSTAAEAASEAKAQEQTSGPINPETIVEELKDKDWGASIKRGVFMLIFGFIGQFALSVTFFLAFLQFVVSLVLGPPNATLTSAIVITSKYLSEILAYLSFKTDDLPFPFGNEFPGSDKK